VLDPNVANSPGSHKGHVDAFQTQAKHVLRPHDQSPPNVSQRGKKRKEKTTPWSDEYVQYLEDTSQSARIS
jgi:hypothetical protein